MVGTVADESRRSQDQRPATRAASEAAPTSLLQPMRRQAPPGGSAWHPRPDGDPKGRNPSQLRTLAADKLIDIPVDIPVGIPVDIEEREALAREVTLLSHAMTSLERRLRRAEILVSRWES